MMGKCKTLLFIGSRSDEGLSAPILRRLEEDDFFRSYVQTLYAGDYYKSFNLVHGLLYDIDLVLCVGDREEMLAAATIAFLDNVPIAHVYAGNIVEGHPTKDEIYRHSISLMSTIQFCESHQARNNLTYLFSSIKKDMNAHVVGITHLDDIEVDESLVPEEPYNLILYNPLTNILKKDIMNYELITVKNRARWGSEYNIVIGSNEDLWIINKPLFLKKVIYEKTTFFDTLPRKTFLGLMKNCKSFITNSSAALYEAPYFLKPEQIINVGIRNNHRTSVDISKVGASDKIIKIIKEWWIKKNE